MQARTAIFSILGVVVVLGAYLVLNAQKERREAAESLDRSRKADLDKERIEAVRRLERNLREDMDAEQRARRNAGPAEKEADTANVPAEKEPEPANGTASHFSPERLARITANPASEKAIKTATEDELDERVYEVGGLDHAELHLVKGHPEAWSWLLVGTRGVQAEDFGPPGSVRDLMAGGPASIHGFPIQGLLYRIVGGPLEGAVLVYSPPSPLSAKPSFQVATVAFHQQTSSMLIGALCDFGLVPGVAAKASSGFKDECFAEVAKRLHKPATVLFPSPWMIRDGADKNCNRSLGGTIDSAPGWRYDCKWTAKTGKTAVEVKRGK